MLKKAYLEITNVCNLACDFCHGTQRKSAFLSVEQFCSLAGKLKGKVTYLYFHLMGEPLLHPELEQLFAIAQEYGFRVILTTNGTLLGKQMQTLLQAPALHKVSISLHCYEVNTMGRSLEEYLHDCCEFCRQASRKGIISVMRLWNRGGADEMNQRILDYLHSKFPGEWTSSYASERLSDRVFLEWGERFDWPDLEAKEYDGAYKCYGLSDQIGVLCDGTVVPCCLDADGVIALGNLFEQELDGILSSERAKRLKLSLQNRRPCEALCKHCGYAYQKKY